MYRLGHALFDDIDLMLGATSGVTADVRNRMTSIRRKAALSAWLDETVAPSVDMSLKSNPSASAASTAYVLLTGNQVEKACEVVMDSGNVKLATLIAQAAGDFAFREDLRTQLEVWREQRVDAHIDEGVRKVYALLAGILDVVQGSKGSGLERCKDVDVFEGLDWKRAFGIHLWFAEPMDAPIAQVFESYNRQRLETPERVIGPCAWYAEQPPLPSMINHTWNVPLSSSTPDALFSLIQLHSDPACSLSHIFNPLSFGSSPLDYSLPWHLYIILSRCMRVRDFSDRGDPGVHASQGDDGRTDADEGVEGHSPSADLLASGYALQLENLGLLQEAVFVLLHIEGSAGYVVLLFLYNSILTQ
jgi:nuclear pore complex protein Nup98-Nup96